MPEGYKTGSSYSAYALFADDSTHSSSVSSAETQQKGPRRVGGTRPRARELTPFCGILKVGGMGTQQWGIYDASPDGDGPSWRDEELGVDEVPFLSSQGSTVSNSSVGSVSGVNRNKRRFDVEDEEERDGVVVLGLGQRVMAVPRRRKVQSQGKMAGIDVVQQENLDFEDADFLDYGLVGEVEMGGV